MDAAWRSAARDEAAYLVGINSTVNVYRVNGALVATMSQRTQWCSTSHRHDILGGAAVSV
jgi:hypothetical protein